MTMQRQCALRPSAATFAVRRRNALQRQDDAGGPAPRHLLLGGINLLFPTRQFRCYFEKIPLLFHCSEKRAFRAASH
jgi:hypothetical protein